MDLSNAKSFLKFSQKLCRYQYYKKNSGSQRDLWDIQDIVVSRLQPRERNLSAGASKLVDGYLMKEPYFQDDLSDEILRQTTGEDIVVEEDMLMEQILDNINSTPLGRVLKRIATLPEVSQEKVLNVRRQLTDGKYDLNQRLDAAVDKVLEDLTA